MLLLSCQSGKDWKRRSLELCTAQSICSMTLIQGSQTRVAHWLVVAPKMSQRIFPSWWARILPAELPMYPSATQLWSPAFFCNWTTSAWDIHIPVRNCWSAIFRHTVCGGDSKKTPARSLGLHPFLFVRVKQFSNIMWEEGFCSLVLKIANLGWDSWQRHYWESWVIKSQRMNQTTTLQCN